VNKDGATKMIRFGSRLSDDEIRALVAYVRTLKK
jgi:mono/diheme cytochrome c family protein